MGIIREQVEEEFDEEIDTNQFLSFEKLCITRPEDDKCVLLELVGRDFVR